MKVVHVAIIVALILGGLVLFDFMRAVNAANSLEVQEVQLRNLDVDLGWRIKVGIPPIEPYIKRVNLELSMLLNNPSDYELRIRELEYEVLLNGRPVASGRMEDVHVPPGRKTLTVPVSINPEEAASALLDAIASAVERGTPYLDFDYEVDGRARVPVTVLGMEIPGSVVTVPFQKEGSYRFSFSLPSISQPAQPPTPAQTQGLVEQEARGTIIVERYGWFIGSSAVTSARPGASARAAVLIRAQGNVDGTVTLELRRDLKYMPDTVLAQRSFRVSLADGEERTLYLDFTVESVTNLRGYFMRVYYDSTPMWEMENSYPPRLAVERTPVIQTTAPVPQATGRWGTLVVERYGWLLEGEPVNRAPSGSIVTAAVLVRASGGDLDGTVTIEVKKDLRFRPDETAAMRDFHISLREGETRLLTLSFVVERGITLRGYYIKVYFDGALVWEMSEGYPPRLKAG